MSHTVADGAGSGFSADQYMDSYPPGMENHWWHRARIRIVRRAIDRFPGATILDIGCGPGIAVSALRSLGYDCWGCEVANPPVREAVADFVRTCKDARDLDAEFRYKVGVITLLDVLEHLPDPSSFLKSIVGAYPNLRGTIVTVPARAELWSAWDDRYGHFRRYNRPMLTQLIDDAGLRLVSMRYFFNSLYPALLAISRLNRRGTSIEAPHSAWPHALLGGLFALEASIPGTGVVVGTSLLGVGAPR